MINTLMQPLRALPQHHLFSVHLRVRQMDQKNPKSLFPSSSAITYWQVEMQEGPIAGKKNQRVNCLGLKDYIVTRLIFNCGTSIYMDLKRM